MRKLAYALAVASIAVFGSFGCYNEKTDSPDGGTGTCAPAVGIAVSTESGGFEVFKNGTLVGSSTGNNVINDALCASRPGDSIRVTVHDRATFVSRTMSGAYMATFDQEGDSVLPVRTSVFTTTGPCTVLIRVQ